MKKICKKINPYLNQNIIDNNNKNDLIYNFINAENNKNIKELNTNNNNNFIHLDIIDFKRRNCSTIIYNI